MKLTFSEQRRSWWLRAALESTRGAAKSVHDALRSVHDCVESLLDVLFSAVLGNFHDAYEGFVNTLESIVGWYVFKIVMT